MRRTQHVRIASSILVVFVVAGLAGCSAQTRLGYLVPAHRNSDASKNELVRVTFYPDPTPTPRGEGAEFALAPLAAPVVALGAKLAVDYVKSELEKEAKRYEAQFTGRAIVSTTDLARSGYLVVERWVDERMLTVGDGDVPSSTSNDYEALKGALATLHQDVRAGRAAVPVFGECRAGQTVASDAQATPKCLSRAAGAVPPEAPGSKKLLAFLFVARVEPATLGGASYRGPFDIAPQYVWLWKTKAKVVDLSVSESWKVWQWIGALALKTEDKANVKVEVAIKAISTDEKTGPQLVSVNTTAPIVAQLQVDLDDPKLHWLSPTSGIWFDVPRYARPAPTPTPAAGAVAHGIGRSRPSSAPARAASEQAPFPEGVGFAVFDVSVTDSDASNVRKLLESGAKQLGDKRDDIAGSVSKLFE